MIETERLILRPWRDDDLDAFAAMSADAEVMRHLNGPVHRDEAIGIVARLRDAQAERGHCFWAAERREDRALIGWCGLMATDIPDTPIRDELEIGWRLARDAWGRGYAREAAEATLAWGWAETGRERILAWTVQANAASWGLMGRLGMERAPELDFEHPRLPPGHPLRPHIVYRVTRPRS